MPISNVMKNYKFFAIAFFIFSSLLFTHLVIGCLFKVLNIECGKTSIPSKYKTIDVNWQLLYPFQIEKGQKYLSAAQSDTADYRFVETIRKITAIGEGAMHHSWLYSNISDIGFCINAIVSNPNIHGNYFRLKNEFWTDVEPCYSDDRYEREISSTIELNDFCNSINCPFMYVQTPVRNCEHDLELPIGIVDFTNYNRSIFEKYLRNSNICYVDLRPYFKRGHYDYFYDTDHHWNIQAGMKACEIIENKMNKLYDFGLVFSCSNVEAFKIKTYRNAMFGSIGTALGKRIINTEDFSINIPIEKTNFHLIIPDKNIDTIGSFEDVFVDYSKLDNMAACGGSYAYETVLFGNRPLIQITNLNNPTGIRILVIKDSFAIAISPYMALDCSQLDLIDVRKGNGNFNGSIKTYIEQTNPDMVLMLLSKPVQFNM